MREPLAAPPARPPRFGLIPTAQAVEDDARWQGPNGFSFLPEGCGTAGRLAIDCIGNTNTMDLPDRPETVDGEAFAVWAADDCSSFGMDARDWMGRARRQLAATESYQVANELWTGSLGLESRSLTSMASDTLTNGGVDPIEGLALLEAGLAACNKGRQGMVHVTPQLLTHLVAAYAVRLDGTTYVTPNGHLVAPDAGYDGSGPGVSPTPAGATQWAYGTSMISVRLSPVATTPDNLSDARQQAVALDRAVNTIVVWAYRAAAWVWDECCHVAAEFDLPAALVGGAS